MPTRESKAFFERSVIRYSKSDVCALLKARLDCAGPLLGVIVNGIDNLGGILYGFKQNSSKNRSVRFMEDRMNISKSLAEFFYSVVRCGVSHQGMPKIGLIFFVEYEYPEKEKIFYKHSNGYICLNIVGLAQRYLNTIDTLNAEIEKHLLHIPSFTDKEKATFEKAKNEITANVDEIANDVGNKRMHDKHPTASYSAYSAKGTLKVSIDSPDQFL